MEAEQTQREEIEIIKLSDNHGLVASLNYSKKCIGD